MVNNAGFTGGRGPLATQTLETYDTVFDTNVRGVFFSLKHELRVMTGQGFGSVVNPSSTFCERGCTGGALYSASKHVVNGFTRSAAPGGGGPGHPCQRRRPRGRGPLAASTASPAAARRPPPP
ncbi:MAG: putative short-chain dehydrogenase [Actinomycetia bacterium]|nr:putative short-chain dehydrogenase [Actinomycetes bacterium]